MKHTKLFVTALLAFGLTSAQSSSSEESREGGKRGKGKRPPLTASIIDAIDTDGDGEISQEEREAARGTIRETVLDKYDTDGDGELSDEEREVIKSEAQEFRSERMSQFDTDGDGELSDDEKAAAREARGDRRPGGKRRGGPQE